MTAPLRADRPARRRRRPSTSRRRPGSPRSCWPGATRRPGPSGGRDAAMRALLELGVKDVAVLRGRGREPDPGRPARSSTTSSWYVPARRWPRTAWSSDGPVGRSTSEPADRRVGAGRGRPWVTTVAGATVNAGGRLVVRATRVGRGHPAGPDRPAWSRRRRTARPTCSGSRTGSPAVFVPVVILVAAATLARAGWSPARARAGGLHRGGGRADHRLPVRAGAGDPRRPSWSAPDAGAQLRHPHQGRGGARSHPPGGHGRARQDRHGDDGPR